ncbi:hypothetical protein [Ancylobacter sp. SL191]|uniref:hypothetical protein n=1 Tax=Ancylobacter sp. SL191 TaxID=2995166 RepID=UPI002271FC02|nr:hypothetical protein [Ancylobacter sp. SL191]WAC26395.1 hypothetical protein OU996_15420 [Ancylobacter sp. SL191]
MIARLKCGKVRNRKMHRRNAGVEAGANFLRTRRVHPGHSSSIRKLQRGFRIAGKDFATIPEAASRAKGRGQ